MDTYWSLSGPRRTTIRQLRHGTVPGPSKCTSTDEARQDETSVLGPSRRLLAGWVVPSFARCDLGRYLAGCRAASGIDMYLDCTLCGWLPCPGQVPWPWNRTWALESRVGEWESGRVLYRFSHSQS